MTKLTKQQIEAIRKRAEAATEGPWEVEVLGESDEVYVFGKDGDTCVYCIEFPYCKAIDVNNAKFIAHAREDIPKLLAEIDRLRSQLAENEEVLAGNCREFDKMEAEMYDAYTKLKRGQKGVALSIIKEFGKGRYDD